MNDAVAVEISMEGMKKLDESTLSQDRDISKVTQSANANKSIDHLLPEYSGIASADQVIHDALKDADNDTKAFVYCIIRSASKEAFISFLQQFAKKNPGFMTSVINREQLTWAK